MAAELIPFLEEASLNIKREKARYMSSYRPAAIEVAGRRLEAEDDVTFLGLSAATGGDPEINARIAAGRRSLHTK